jgi:hypothetical protein
MMHLTRRGRNQMIATLVLDLAGAVRRLKGGLKRFFSESLARRARLFLSRSADHSKTKPEKEIVDDRASACCHECPYDVGQRGRSARALVLGYPVSRNQRPEFLAYGRSASADPPQLRTGLGKTSTDFYLVEITQNKRG